MATYKRDIAVTVDYLTGPQILTIPAARCGLHVTLVGASRDVTEVSRELLEWWRSDAHITDQSIDYLQFGELRMSLGIDLLFEDYIESEDVGRAYRGSGLYAKLEELLNPEIEVEENSGEEMPAPQEEGRVLGARGLMM